MNKAVVGVCLALCYTVIAACGSTPSEPEVPEQAENISTEAEYISPGGGGIGDTRANFDDRRNKGEQLGESQAIYQNGYIRATFVEGSDYDLENGRAQRIDISFGNTNTPAVSMERALEIAETFLPEDATKESEQQDADGFYHIQYSSDSLSEVFSPGWFHQGEPGDVTATFWQREGNPGQIFAITIGTGGIIK